jgi:hypothetical protein
MYLERKEKKRDPLAPYGTRLGTYPGAAFFASRRSVKIPGAYLLIDSRKALFEGVCEILSRRNSMLSTGLRG